MIKTLLISILFQYSYCFNFIIADLQTPINYFGLAEINNGYPGICIAGGLDNQNNLQSGIYCNNLDSQWILVGNLSVPRMKISAVSILMPPLLSAIFFGGGCDNNLNNPTFYPVIDIYYWSPSKSLTFSISLTQSYQNISSAVIPEFSLVFFAGVISQNPPLSGIDTYNITESQVSGVTFPNLIIINIFVNSKNQIVVFAINYQENKEVILLFDYQKKTYTNYYTSYGDINYIAGLTFLQDKNILVKVMDSFMVLLDLNTKNNTRLNLPISKARYGIPKISYNGLIFIAGGNYYDETLQGQTVSDVQIYDVNKQVWTFNALSQKLASPNPVYINKGTTLIYVGGISSYKTLSSGLIIPIFSSSSSAFTLCAGGSYGILSSEECKQCPIGFFCPAGTFILEISYSPSYRSCPQGTYCPVNSSVALNCPAGTYNSNFMSTSISDCLSCPAGTFNIFSAQISIDNCVKCQLGSICQEKSTIPLPCPANYYCPQPTNQIACPIGTYYRGNNAISVDSCLECSTGFYCSGNGLSESPCQAGSYSDKMGSSKCDICPEGFYCQFGTSTPLPCQKNFYAPKGSAGCTPCADGEFTKGIGSTSCLICPASKFSVDGWWCMTTYERLIFVGIWLASIISGSISLWKTYSLIKKRFQKIKDYGYVPTIRTFLFLEKMNRRNVNLTQVVDDKPFLQDDQLRRMQYIVDKLQVKMDLLESNSRS